MRLACLVLILGSAVAWPAALQAQSSAPAAISGDPSSATHCISANAANIHHLGWVTANTNYTVTFETGIPLHTAVGRVSLTERQTTIAYGNPDIARNSATAGTMALFVGGGGKAGCYRYKVSVSAAALTAPAETVRATLPASPAYTASARAISGTASSATHCISGTSVANVHDLGRVEQGQRIALTFASNFDAAAGAHIVNLPTQQSTGYTDDNSGGGVEPALTILAPHAGALALHVAGVNGANGCYRFKVEIR